MESLEMFVKLGNQRGIAESLASLAAIWSDRGQLLPAAKLLGAAQALLDATGATWWPADRGEVEANLENLQKNIEPAQFKAAWQAGSMLNLDAAINLVKYNQ